MRPLVLTPLIEIPIVNPGDDVAGMIIHSLQKTDIKIVNDDILVVAQKIVSKAEGRFVDLRTVEPSSQALGLAEKTGKDPRLIELVLEESNCVLRTRKDLIIVEHRNGFVCANAGIDHSNVQSFGGNAEEWVLLLPKDANRSADLIRKKLEEHYGCKLGVLIIDSHGRAWRMGTVGVSIGFSGIPGIVDLRGQQDLFGYILHATFVAAADELAAAASLIMGQANERVPVIHVRGFPYPLREGNLAELIRPIELDMFR